MSQHQPPNRGQRPPQNQHHHQQQQRPPQHAGGQPPRRRRRRNRTLRRIVVVSVMLVAVLGCAWGITLLIEGSGDKTLPGGSSQATGSASGNGSAQQGADNTGLPDAGGPQWNQVGPLVQRTDVMEVITPDLRMIALPENGRVSMEFFNSAAIYGDSLAQGFAPGGIHNGGYDILNSTSARLFTYRGVGPKQMFDGSLQTNQHGTEEAPLEALVASAPDNVYVMLGANAMYNSSDDPVILEYYGSLLDTLKERLGPEVGIYVQSVTPVTPGNSAGFNIDRIRGFNNYLAKMTWEKGLYFLDLHEALADDEGWLRGEFAASDGYHLNKDGYLAWTDYLLTHTVYNERHAGLYLEGSQFYEPQPRPADPA